MVYQAPSVNKQLSEPGRAKGPPTPVKDGCLAPPSSGGLEAIQRYKYTALVLVESAVKSATDGTNIMLHKWRSGAHCVG